jgi:hypothetical protein
VVFENVRKVLACRTPVLGCHVWECDDCGHVKLMPHSCKSRLCPTCGKHATDVWADRVLNALLDVPYHHLTGSCPISCPDCNEPMTYRGMVFGSWGEIQELFMRAGYQRPIPSALLKPG